MRKWGLESNKGFTLVELAVVAAILVIISIAAFSTFTSSNQIMESEMGQSEQLMGAIRAGLAARKANLLAQGQVTNLYPSELDSVAVSAYCSSSNPCFTAVVDPSWLGAESGELTQKIEADCYRVDSNGSGTSDSQDVCISYNSSTGGVQLAYSGNPGQCTASNCQGEMGPGGGG